MTTQLTYDRFEILCREDMRRAIDENIERDPVAVALDRHIPSAADAATQIKYLQRARRKLPSYYQARCILPSRAFEQSSGEACALRKPLAGESAVDLTCGLGVDAFALSKRFRRVVAVERDEVLAEVARENFRRLGAGNIEVVCDTAEHFVSECRERFDWCFADPDRRGTDGRKKVLVEDCSPDIAALMPAILNRVAARSCIKMSPMFDVDEAFRLFSQFGPCSVEVVSAADECKEVLVYTDAGREPSLTAVAIGKGEFSAPQKEKDNQSIAKNDKMFEPGRYGWLIVPDVALQKARLVRRCFGKEAFAPSENGFVFAGTVPDGEVLGRVFEIESVQRYDPRRLRREMKGLRTEIMLRDTRLTAARILKEAGMREGGDARMAFTDIGGEIWAIRLK